MTNPRSRFALLRMLLQQELYRKHKEEGITDKYIHRKYVAPHFPGSLKNFQRILGRNVRKELTELGYDVEQLLADHGQVIRVPQGLHTA